ncbi:MAG: alpha/beta hydrolase [Anaerolineales bacterium]|nr:alpha/beta hydrolase [Anaerolineales bacterium]
MKKILKYTGLTLLAVLLLGVLGFVFWAENPLGPGPEALAALQSDEQVVVTAAGDFTTFQPASLQPTTGLIFYPGGHVDERSYAPALREIAVEGYLVVLVPAPLNLMVFAPHKAGTVLPRFPLIEHWAVGGHSLGGAMAANYIYAYPEAVEALVLWASYPAESNDLSRFDIDVLSVYGDRDMAGMAPFIASRERLPSTTEWLVIEGGNHAQFGDYGVQPGDNQAAISRVDQQRQAVEATAAFLGQLGQ